MLKGTERPRGRIEAQSFRGVPCGDTDEVEKNETHTRIHIDFSAHARNGSQRVSRPAKQRILSGKGVFSTWEKNVTLRSGETKNLTLRLIYAKDIPKAYVKRNPKQ